MALEFKKRSKQNLLRYEADIIDNSADSPEYFRVSSIPEYLGDGKNAFRILGSESGRLATNSEIRVEVLDSRGNVVYHEIPNYETSDGTRIVTVWVYSDRDNPKENTPRGLGSITILGITRDEQVVRWTQPIPIRPTEPSVAPIIFQSPNIPTATCSASLEPYDGIPQDENGISLTSQQTKVKYLKSNYGEDISLQRSSSFGSNFTGEMVDGEIRLDLSDINLYPESKGTTQPTSYTGSIKAISGSDIIRLVSPITASDPRGDGSTHTYIYSDTADISGSIVFFSSASNASTQNFEAVANITLPNLNPILGKVFSVNTSIKSKGFGGDFENLANTRITSDSDITYKVKIPSKHIGDPKTIRIQFLNKNGEISDTFVLIKDIIFQGANTYIGGSNSLISGSIFISNTLGSGIEIGGASSGFIRSVGFEGQTSASSGDGPGGFIIYSGSGNLQVGADTLNGVGVQLIGDNDDRHFIFTTENGGLLDVKTDKFFIGTQASQFISGANQNIEISSSLFHLDPQNNSLVIGADATILSDLTVDNIRTPAVVNGAPSTEANASSSIKADGFARFVSASIGGWAITTASIEGGNLIMQPEGILQTRDFATGIKGWKISSEGNGTAEFENIRIRGTLRTTTFEKESVNAVGGQLWVANSTTITGSVLATDTTMSVKNASGFSDGEILLIKRVDGTGFQTEYVRLNSASIDGDNSGEDEVHGRIMVTRAYGSGSSGDFVGDLASAAQAYEDGQVIVSTGKLNTGYIKMNANPNDTATPYIDIVERTGSGLYDVALKARIGDLSGLSGNEMVYGNDNPGFGIATDNVFLQGGIIANTGSIGGIKMESGKLYNGQGTWGNTNTGFYVDSASNFSLADKLTWDGSSLVIRGQIQLTDGTDVGDALAEATSSNTAKVVSLTADSYVITFDADGNEDPASQTIGLTASAQNFGDSVYYEFYKDSSLQGSRTTTNTFDVDTIAEKPTATTPVTYEVRTFESASGGTSVASDSLTLFGIKPGAAGSDGSDGSDGTDAYTVILTNESHTLQTANDGTVTYTDSGTDIVVYRGTTELNGITEGSPTTGQFKVTASGTNISVGNITSTGNPVVVADHSSMTADTAKVTFTIDTEGSASFTKVQSLSKAKEGSDGLDGSTAKTLTATVDSQVFAFDTSTDTTATPSEVIFSFNQQNLSGTIGSSDITITAADSTNITGFTLNDTDVSAGSGIVSGSLSFSSATNAGGLNSDKAKLPVTISVTKDSLTDSIKVFKVEGGADGAAGSPGSDGSDGTDAVTAFLTNENHTFAAGTDGSVVSFDGGTTDMIVYEGITDVTSNYTFSRTNSTGVTSTISTNTVTITGLSHDSGSVAITATSASVSLEKTMSLAKSKQGSQGLAGSNAKILTLTADSQVFAFDDADDTTAADDDILLIITQQNLSGTIGTGDLTIVDSGGTTLTDPTLKADVTNGSGQVSGSITFSSTLSATKSKLPITVTVSKDGLEDSLKIFKVEGGSDGAAGSPGSDGSDGTDALTTFLTNESHTFPADSSGTIASFANAETDMIVFQGINDVTSDYTYTRTSNTGVTSTISSNTVTITGMTHDSGSVIITATSASTTLNKTMSLAKSKQGNDGGDGTSAKLLIGSLDSQVFAFDDSSDTSATPTNIVFSFQQQNLSGTIGSSDISITRAGGGTITGFAFNNSDVSNGTGVVSGSIVFANAVNNGGAAGTKSNLPITITATKDGLSDSVKIFKVEGGTNGSPGSPGSDGDDGTPGSDGSDGADAVTAFLTNENHTFAAQNNGTIISFTGGSTDMEVFEGITNKSSNYSFSRTNSSGVTSTISSNTVTVTAMSHDSGSITITATSASVSLAKTMSLAKSKQGDDGADGTPGTPGTPGTDGTPGNPGPPGADNQDFSWANENLTGVGPASAGLLMTSNVFGFHGNISSANATLDDFTSYLDSDGNFYLGSGSSNGTFLNWNNTDASLFITGSQADIRVDKFVLGNLNTQYVSGSNGNIEISSSNFHLSSSGELTLQGDLNAETGTFKDVKVLGGLIKAGASGSHNIETKYRNAGNGTLQSSPTFPGQAGETVSDAPLWVETWVTQSSTTDLNDLNFVLGSGVGAGSIVKRAIPDIGSPAGRGLIVGGTNVWQTFRGSSVPAGEYLANYSASITLTNINGGKSFGPNGGSAGSTDNSLVESTKQFRTLLSLGGDLNDYEKPIYQSSGSWSGSEKLYKHISNLTKERILNSGGVQAKLQGVFPRWAGGSTVGEATALGITSDIISLGETVTLDDAITLQFDASFVGSWNGFGFVVRVDVLKTNGTTVLGTYEQTTLSPQQVLQFDVPLSTALRSVSSFAPSQITDFRIRVRWYKNSTFGGGTGAYAAQIKLSEMRIMKGVRATSINAGMLALNNKVTLTGREIMSTSKSRGVLTITGDLVPETTNTYSLGEDELYQGFKKYWKNLYLSGELKLYSGTTNIWSLSGNYTETRHIRPLTNSAYDLGGASNRWSRIYTDIFYALEGGLNLRPRLDNSYDLGGSSYRWDDVRATNSVIQTSDRNDKTNISGSTLGLDFVNSLNPVSFQWVSGSRTHYGLIAQEVSASLMSASINTSNFAGFVKSDIYESSSFHTSSIDTSSIDTHSVQYDTKELEKGGFNIDDFTYVKTTYGLRYSEFISPMIKAIQELSDEVTYLKQQISGSNG